MNHREISAKGGRALSIAKTAANRKKIRAYWAAVRRGEATPPLRRRFTEDVKGLAARYIWWEPPTRSLRRPVRVAAQVLAIGTQADCVILERELGPSLLRQAIEGAEPGWFDERSWTYWHYRLGLTPWGGEPPRPPVRALP